MVGYGTAATALARSRGGWLRPEPFSDKDGKDTSPPPPTTPPLQNPREAVVLLLGEIVPQRASLPTMFSTGSRRSVSPSLIVPGSSSNNAVPSTRAVGAALGAVVVMVVVQGGRETVEL